MLTTCPFCISTDVTEVTTIGGKSQRFYCRRCLEHFDGPVTPHTTTPANMGDEYQSARALLSNAHLLMSQVQARDDEHRALLASAQTLMARADDVIRAMEAEYPLLRVPF